MRKIVSVFIFLLLLCTKAHAATWYGCTTMTGWSNTSSWTSVSADQGTCAASLGAPAAGDTAILNSSSGSVPLDSATADVAATVTMTGYTHTLTLTTGDSLIVTGGTITLGGTITGTGTLKITGAETLTSNSIVWSGATNFNAAATVTLTASSTWESTGLTTFSGVGLLLTPSSSTIKTDGGLTVSASMSASSVAIIDVTGGTLTGGSNADVIYGPLDLGTMTLSTHITYGGSALTLNSGSTITGTTSDIFDVWASFTLTSNSVTFPGTIFTAFGNLTGSPGIITLSGVANIGGLQINGSSEGSQTVDIQGAYNATFGTLEEDALLGYTVDLVLLEGQTYTVTGNLWLNGVNANSFTATTTEMVSSTSTPALLNYTGTPSNISVYNMKFTDINASGSSQAIYNWNGSSSSAGNTDIINVNQNNIGGIVAL